MNIYKISTKLAGLLLLTIMTFGMPEAAQAAFGISPPNVSYDHLKPGTTYQKVVTVSTSETDVSSDVKLSYSGDESLRKWLKVEGGMSQVIPAGQKQLPITLSIAVPEGASKGRYQGNLAVVFNNDKQNNAIEINLGANIGLSLNVTSRDYEDYALRSVNPVDVIEGRSLVFEVLIDNKGNTDLDEIDLTAQIWSQNEKDLITTLKGGKLSKAIPAYGAGSAFVYFDDVIPTGKYWVKSSVVKGRTEIYASKQLLEVSPIVVESDGVKTTLDVLRDGEIQRAFISDPEGGSGKGVSTSLRVKSPYEDAIIYSILTLIILIGIGFAYKHKKG